MMKTKRKISWIIASVAILLAMFIGGCEDKNVETVGVCPVVLSTSPANSAIDVPLDQIITVTFNEEMNPATITPAAFSLHDALKSLDEEISGSLTYNATNATMTFVPGTELAANTTYTATVYSTVKDLMGNFLQTNYVWTFNTGTTTSATVISTDPANNATGVFLNKKIIATFSEPMDPLTITTTTFTIKQGNTLVSGTVLGTGTTASFTPSGELLANTLYTGTITIGVKNLSGTILAKDYVWTFSTGIITAPKVNATDPENEATGVELNKVISATFSEDMDASTITTATFTLMIGTTLVPGTVDYSGTTATFTPTSNLISGTYTATISSAVKNVSGTPMAIDYV